MSHSMKSPWLQDNRRQIGMEAVGLLRKIAQELQLTEEDLIRQGLRAFLEQRIRELRAEWIAVSYTHLTLPTTPYV
jgi:transcriptional regulator with XRE-family HTH domain